MKRILGSLVIVTTFLLGLAPTSAHAADELGLSWDGRSWSAHLNGSLFDRNVRWVPGDVRTNEFYVRNQAPDGGNLTISVVSRDQDRLLRNDDISLTARVSGNDWIALERTGEAFRLRRGALGAGESERIQVRAAFDPASTNRSQRDELALDFRVTLTDARSADGDKKDDNDAGLLPDAGAPAVGFLILLAGAMLGAGLALLKRRGREDSDGTAC